MPAGNHILSSEDLALFHWNLLGPDHPLNGLRVGISIAVCIIAVAWPVQYVISHDEVQ